ncbi:conserved hypothetical protein [Histoplasma capsulatum G186AR]|uniref:Vacuolar ATPase assembly protein VMA22 n=1 Tax=Ajellomyces capsulatus (strain G186AR / H82 / ATCC MYA-2454 / RMSCC 2432) TaxID=447093 RepID=C0NYJ5_AJECG|nr:uncharacterized protein HCBG_07677 [Histoplasma capsulatum G186AR]EEH03551.1 conserved hypothetical protein [Histoplasma capsulatum G186AR]
MVQEIMDQLPTPPATPADGAASSELSSPTEKSLVELSQELDSVLERYLHLLDQQQRLQQEIGREFSSGFLSLACANKSCPPGRRYGEDYYDERMKAIRKLPSFTVESVSLSPPNAIEPKDVTENGNEETNSKASSRSSDPDELNISTESEKSRANGKRSNPINWFGILVPPALRSAQQSFCTAVDGPIPLLATVITEMRGVERDIEVLRGMLAAATVDNDGNEK